MAEPAVALVRAATTKTFILTGHTSFVADAHALHVPTAPSAAAASLITTISSPLPVAPRAPPPDIEREFPVTLVAGETVVPWTVDVPEGFYVVSARVDEDGGPHVTVIDSPRFWVSGGPDVSCLNRVSPSPSPSLSDAPSDTPGPSLTSGDDDARSPSQSGTAKLLLPPAAIVGIAIGAAALLVLCILICTWDRNRHRNAAAREKEMRQVQAHRLSSSSSFFDRDVGSRAWYTSTNPNSNINTNPALRQTK